MTVVATNPACLAAEALLQRWLDPAHGLVAQIAQQMQERGAHPARTLVLLPFAQLVPLARRMWTRSQPSGFAPRFETTLSWARSSGPTTPDAQDIMFERGRDLLSAQSLLERAGLGAARDVLAARLLESACALALVVAATPPQERAAWGDTARAELASGLDLPALALESALARLALEWALASSYATDVLFEPVCGTGPGHAWDLLVVLEGFQAEPLTQTLQALRGERAVVIALEGAPAAPAAIALHPAAHSEDEAERAAACVLRHIEQGRVPVALAATDRVLTRRIRAMLGSGGVAIRDETGWTLSTTRAAAHVMACLRAGRWDASTDAVLDWLKNLPAVESQAVAVLEHRLRRAGVAQWRSVAHQAIFADKPDQRDAPDAPDLVQTLLAQVAQWRDALARSRPLSQWLTALRQTLEQAGVFSALRADAAGAQVIEVLRLGPQAQTEFDALAQAARRISLAEFSAWVDAVLDAANFVPQSSQEAQVVILPLSQLLARPFAALVLPGCDEVRLSPSPEPAGDWTPRQREALGLPAREELARARRAAWRYALQTPHCDLLWRQHDDTGEPLLPSTLVQALQLEACGALDSVARTGSDARVLRSVAVRPTLAPLPQGDRLPLARITATAYEDLRRCPYRFFALRQLGLQEADELEGEVDKRDFGLWLHAVLKAFHDALQQACHADEAASRRALMDDAARCVTASLQLDEAEFVPFAAAWPAVRDGYLEWLGAHEATGARFEVGESAQEQALGTLTLLGKIDRIDHLSDGSVLLLDYKTESAAQTGARVKQPFEDTQLAFYAALMPQDTLRAAYVNVSEKGGSKTYEEEQVVAVRHALIEGLLHDMQRIQAGATLAALGEGAACDFCAARGLCRKDFWTI